MSLILFPEVCDEATGRCYWSTGTPQTWNNGRTACQAQGGDLAVMETQELWNFVLNKSANLGSVIVLYILTKP